MTVKEIEQASGMTRANIRYYEQMGMISPKRESNGYRDYSQTELDMLLRIKLLRSLQLPIEQIKRLQSGEESLKTLLNRQIDILTAAEQGCVSAKKICEQIKEDGAAFETLDAAKYLNGASDGAEYEQTDVTKDVFYPARRFCARVLDMALYALFADWLMQSVLHMNPGIYIARFMPYVESVFRTAFGSFGAEELLKMLLLPIVIFVPMVVFEPIFLRLFGTTPGKWVFALRLEDDNGCRPGYLAALKRTCLVFVKGMGCGIPFLIILRLAYSFRTCYAEKTMDWDYDLEYRMTNNSNARYAVFAAAIVAINILTYVIAQSSMMTPVNRGDLTVAELAENYNTFAKYYDFDSRLDSNGRWKGVGFEEDPVFETDENGNVRAVKLKCLGTPYSAIYDEPSSKADIITLAFIGAQKNVRLFSRDQKEMWEWVIHPRLEYERNVAGVTVAYGYIINDADVIDACDTIVLEMRLP